MEGKILGAEERGVKLEYELFLRVRETVLAQLAAIQGTAFALAQLDVLAAFAETARLFNFCRPEVGDEGRLQIREGRHPVLDQALTEERFVPNDTELASVARIFPPSPSPAGERAGVRGNAPGDSVTEPIGTAAPHPDPLPSEGEREDHSNFPQIILITGPNMAGKSTYIRQVALLALLAHTGSFIPAASARIDLLDRIFSRIGASDDLARGQSTFMVEMTETANILNNATSRSLVLLDEIGRGTSTYDGIAIAWSVAEYLLTTVHKQAKTLFATHYSELTKLSQELPKAINYQVAVSETTDGIVFNRKIIPGGTDKSYGIHVAKLAGIPYK